MNPFGLIRRLADRKSIRHKWQNVSALWDERARSLVSGEKPSSWTDSPLVQTMYIHPKISGEAHVNWLEYIARQYFPEPVGKALSLGCGGGGLERHGSALHIAEKFVAYDVSEGALDLARQMAKELGFNGISYRVADLNTLAHPENEYDVVFASQSLHHIEAIEHYLDQVMRTLKPGGLFIINEYIGPNQFQWNEEQLKHSQSLLREIPKKYRKAIHGGGLKSKITRPTIEHMNNIDPTEAIQSELIVPEIEKRFEILERKDFGGTLLQLVLDDIVGNFEDTPEDRQVLQQLFDRESALLGDGIISSDFTMMVMRNSVAGSSATS